MDIDSSIYDEGISSGTKLHKKPKIRLYKLTDDKKIVNLTINIKINDNLVIKDTFDWDLNDENISPKLYAEQFVKELFLPEINITEISN